MRLQNDSNGFLFKSRDQAIRHGEKIKMDNEPEQIAFLTDKLIKLNNAHLSAMQTNTALFHDCCFEYLAGNKNI